MKTDVFTSALTKKQIEMLHDVVTLRFPDEGWELEKFVLTTTDRNVPAWTHEYLIAALDNLNSYQEGRLQQGIKLGGVRIPVWSPSYTKDPRTKILELLKHWLRMYANNDSLPEGEVRRVYNLCDDILYKPQLFPPTYYAVGPETSFLNAIADVKGHLEKQLIEVLKSDHTCAELAKEVVRMSKNLISDVLTFLLSSTSLLQSDKLPSLEVVQLWQSLPESGHPLPSRTNKRMQRDMASAWRTQQTGLLLAAVLRDEFCVSLFDRVCAEEEKGRQVAALEVCESASEGSILSRFLGSLGFGGGGSKVEPEPPGFKEQLELTKAKFESGDFNNCGLPGALRQPKQAFTRAAFLDAVLLLHDLMYLLGEVFEHIRGVTDCLGDYGMIRAAFWLHPLLDSLTHKVNQLKVDVEHVNTDMVKLYVEACARQEKVEKPAPSQKMQDRARSSWLRAFSNGDGGHHQALLKSIHQLKDRSSLSRLKGVQQKVEFSINALDTIFKSSQFRDCVGDVVELPTSPDTSPLRGAAELTDVDSSANSPEANVDLPGQTG